MISQRCKTFFCCNATGMATGCRHFIFIYLFVYFFVYILFLKKVINKTSAKTETT